MGVIIEFQARNRAMLRAPRVPGGSGDVVILPVIRIERHAGDPASPGAERIKKPTIRRRRRRSARICTDDTAVGL